jgi:hypothetical protein
VREGEGHPSNESPSAAQRKGVNEFYARAPKARSGEGCHRFEFAFALETRYRRRSTRLVLSEWRFLGLCLRSAPLKCGRTPLRLRTGCARACGLAFGSVSLNGWPRFVRTKCKSCGAISVQPVKTYDALRYPSIATKSDCTLVDNYESPWVTTAGGISRPPHSTTLPPLRARSHADSRRPSWVPRVTPV